MAEYFPLEPALWFDTAAAAPETQPLAKSTTADIAIVGAGYAGLSTALYLAERGLKPVVIEARQIGFGGSGRNGGQVIPGLKYDPDEIVTKFGKERGERLVDFSAGGADAVFGLIDRYRMDVAHVRNGWIQGAHTSQGLKEAESRADQWSRRGAPVTVLDRAEVTRLIGSERYLGGWIDGRGGAVQPLSYARGLACAALSLGASIYTGTPATALQRKGSGWVIATSRGVHVEAQRVVVCTNGYTGNLWPGLARTIVAFNSFQVATEPLKPEQRRSILPEGHVSSDTRKLLLYFRLDDEGRLLMGGRGRMRDPDSPSDWAHIERIIAKMFPHLEGVNIAYRWGGRVAMTRDFMPHLHQPAEGLLIDIGCQGRGVGLQTAMGRAIAEYLATGNGDVLPVAPTPIKPIPFHGWNRFYVSALIAWYRMTDAGM